MVKLESYWHVERTGGTTWAGIVARHTQSGAEFWAPSTPELGREIRKAAAFLTTREWGTAQQGRPSRGKGLAGW